MSHHSLTFAMAQAFILARQELHKIIESDFVESDLLRWKTPQEKAAENLPVQFYGLFIQTWFHR